MNNKKIHFNDFIAIKMAVGTIVEAKEFPKAKKPAYQLLIDFGEEIGLKKSSAQITAHYNISQLVGRQIIAVINFEPKNIAGFLSEVLVLGVALPDHSVILLNTDTQVPNGSIIS